MELEEYLKGKNLWHKFIEKEETVHTADAAKATGLELARITKSLVLKTDEGPVMAIIPGNRKLSFEKLKKVVGKARLVPFEEAKNYSGYEPGATPMIHHKVPMKVVVDESLLSDEVIYGGGGSRNKLLGMKVKDIIEENNAIVADITYASYELS